MVGICSLTLIPVRREPSHRSELTTQILFGEHFRVLEDAATWCRVQLAHDGYEGWVDAAQVTRVSREYGILLENERQQYCSFSSIGIAINKKSGERTHILPGSPLPLLDSINTIRIEGTEYLFEGGFYSPTGNYPNDLERISGYFLNTPYLWGGRSLFGIDCSGFVQIVSRFYGVKLPRDAYQQVESGTQVAFDSRKCGDLAFFQNDEGRITHVGILLNENTIIHASGRVRVDGFDQTGIYDREAARYTHTFKTLTRI